MATTTATTVDMTAKVGGRVFTPALPVVDGSPPTPLEVQFQSSLEEYSKDHIPIESREGIQRRERVLAQLGALCRAWIRDLAQQKNLPTDVRSQAGGQLYTSGSYRLGVHEPGADIDTILVAPNYCHRGDFFGTSNINPLVEDQQNQRDPNSLAERIKRHSQVTNFVPVEGAVVPLLTFDWEGINIDLLFARLNSNTVNADFDINQDAVLDGVDTATEKSLNGPRVTNLIAALVSGTPERYQIFLTVVRCIRTWAKQRGLYKNVMGYWGGVNINIGVALVVQLYPNACPAALLRKFFLVFSSWRWPQPIMLCNLHDAGYGLNVWNAQTSLRQIAPMITPAYPAMNSTLAVSRQTLQILQEEFNRGLAIMDNLWKTFQKNPNMPLDWSSLFAPSDFFIAYPHYLSLCIVGPTEADAQAWAGFVVSRLRKLVSDILGRSMPVKKIQLWPNKLEYCIADRSALLTQAQRQNSTTYFIGFHVDTMRMRGKQLNIEGPMQNFRDWELKKFQPLVNGMDVLAKAFTVRELPKVCFETIYPGGKLEAMQKRYELRKADPVRQEKKRLKRLAELKAKMADLQKKKDDKKRKRDDVDAEEEALQEQVEKEAEAVTDNDNNENTDEGTTEQEAVLLESALDAMLKGDRTKEEVEAERQKLLSGEMLGDGKPEYNEDEEDEEYAGAGEGARTSVFFKKRKENKYKGMRCLPPKEEDAEFLRSLGYAIVSDDESKVIIADVPSPFQGITTKTTTSVVSAPPPTRVQVKFLEKFDVVELDSNGHVIDKGDDDFKPSMKWTGRQPGFEFKLGERGLGYYRTGKKVVVPSNMAY